jgi:hypothetical protein
MEQAKPSWSLVEGCVSDGRVDHIDLVLDAFLTAVRILADDGTTVGLVDEVDAGTSLPGLLAGAFSN